MTLGRSRSGGIFRREDAESAEAEVEGSCFGESGGPILYDSSDVILGVNSFVINGQCRASASRTALTSRTSSTGSRPTPKAT